MTVTHKNASLISLLVDLGTMWQLGVVTPALTVENLSINITFDSP